jgi:hypothetical protein
MISEAQIAVTPAGRPVGVPIPVAPVVICVISDRYVWMHSVGVAEAAETVFAETVMVPVALVLPQPPVSGMV